MAYLEQYAREQAAFQEFLKQTSDDSIMTKGTLSSAKICRAGEVAYKLKTVKCTNADEIRSALLNWLIADDKLSAACEQRLTELTKIFDTVDEDPEPAQTTAKGMSDELKQKMKDGRDKYHAERRAAKEAAAVKEREAILKEVEKDLKKGGSKKQEAESNKSKKKDPTDDKKQEVKEPNADAKADKKKEAKAPTTDVTPDKKKEATTDAKPDKKKEAKETTTDAKPDKKKEAKETTTHAKPDKKKEAKVDVADSKQEATKPAKNKKNQISEMPAEQPPKEDQDVKKNKKDAIPKILKDLCWYTWIGKTVASHNCLCCERMEIRMNNFECGHVLAEAKGGQLSVDNLRPICGGCNRSMGAENLEDFKRRCGFGELVKSPCSVKPKQRQQESVPVAAASGFVDDSKPSKAAQKTESAKAATSSTSQQGAGAGAGQTQSEPNSVAEQAAPLYERRKTIASGIKDRVWDKHVGTDLAKSKCQCCKYKPIEVGTFVCAHFKGEAQGGTLSVDNLRPICTTCDLDIGVNSISEFMKMYNIE